MLGRKKTRTESNVLEFSVEINQASSAFFASILFAFVLYLAKWKIVTWKLWRPNIIFNSEILKEPL